MAIKGTNQLIALHLGVEHWEISSISVAILTGVVIVQVSSRWPYYWDFMEAAFLVLGVFLLCPLAYSVEITLEIYQLGLPIRWSVILCLWTSCNFLLWSSSPLLMRGKSCTYLQVSGNYYSSFGNHIGLSKWQ